ncbi:twin-arginine translocation signal domain-containing protein [bacterium]|nr:twin-arginine translocation signal domain-containing protein [bacterium]
MTDPQTSRRGFLRDTAVVAGALSATAIPSVHAQGSDTIKVGVIGCGGRGTGAAENCADSAPGVKIYAMGDLFPDHLDNSRKRLKSALGDRYDVADTRAFSGFDAYKKVIDSDVDLVILATPPGFRPQMIEYTVEKGKNLFTEKPVGVDGTGIRKVLAAYEKAKEKNLAIVAGTQRRHQAPYIESMKRIHEGEIGELVGGRCYWNQGALWHKDKLSEWSEMEWQVRNWLYFTWLSGDHIVEQHVHNLDVINWAFQQTPTRAVALGGRQQRTDPVYGQIFDHFATDLEYANGVHVLSMARQIPGCENNVSEALVGTKGTWNSNGFRFTGESRTRIREMGTNPYVQEHTDLIASIRAGKPLNELKTVAESTLTAIMCRMSAYTGKAVTWEQALNSKEDTFPKNLEFGPNAVPPVAIPGVTELI